MFFGCKLFVCLSGVFWCLDYSRINEQIFIKRPAKDACLCMGDLQAPPAPAAPPAPHFVFLITL